MAGCPVVSIPVAQLGWMAGVLDLKGSIIRKKNQQRRTPQFVLYVETKQHAVVQRLGSMVGTAPEKQPPKNLAEIFRRGCIEHCPEQHVHVSSPYEMPAVSRWTITGLPMAIVLFNVLPYLTTDKGWLDIMNEAMSYAPEGGQGRGAIDKAIRRLAALGWDIPQAAFAVLEPLPEITDGKEAGTLPSSRVLVGPGS